MNRDKYPIEIMKKGIAQVIIELFDILPTDEQLEIIVNEQIKNMERIISHKHSNKNKGETERRVKENE